MKILLLNDNPVVNKLVTLSAQKTSDELDVVDSLDSLQPGEYDLLIVDDTMYNDDMFSELKSKIIFSSSLYICSRDAAKVEAFSSTLKKPFLPTDLVELFLKFSKEVNMSSSSKEEIATDPDELEEFDTQELVLDEDLDTEELSLEDEDLDLSLDDELLLEDDELVLEDDDLNLDDELSLGDEELDDELLFDDEDLTGGESILDDDEAQKVKDLLDETSDEVVAEYDIQFAADELGLPLEEVEEFLQDFIVQAKEFKDELYNSAVSGDLDQIKALSHKLKGVAANLRVDQAIAPLDIVNSSSDTEEIESHLNSFYRVIDKLEGVETSSADEDDISTDIDELEEFSSDDNLELDDELEEFNTEELEHEDELELDDELMFDEEEAESAIDEAVTEELALEDELEDELELELPDEIETKEDKISEDDLELDDELMFDEEEAESAIDEAVTEELALEKELEDELELPDDLELDEEEAESAIDEAITEELGLEEELELPDELMFDEEVNISSSSEEEETTDLDELEEFSSEELELAEEVQEPEEELDLETQIENAVEELSDEDLESELDEETLLEIATNEIDSLDAFDSLTSNDLKLAIGEEVNSEELEISRDDTDLDKLEELNQEVTTSQETEVQANSIEALENLLEVLKDKDVVASLKGTKININITIGGE